MRKMTQERINTMLDFNGIAHSGPSLIGESESNVAAIKGGYKRYLQSGLPYKDQHSLIPLFKAYAERVSSVTPVKVEETDLFSKLENQFVTLEETITEIITHETQQADEALKMVYKGEHEELLELRKFKEEAQKSNIGYNLRRHFQGLTRIK